MSGRNWEVTSSACDYRIGSDWVNDRICVFVEPDYSINVAIGYLTFHSENPSGIIYGISDRIY